VGLFSKVCSICDASPELREAVNRLLDQKPRTPYWKIAATIGTFSKSSIHRHSRHYGGASSLPRIYKGEKYHPIWPGQDVPANAGPQDWLVIIEYEKPLTPESAPNPFALTPEPETATVPPPPAEPLP
jgi:hypothetical protein